MSQQKSAVRSQQGTSKSFPYGEKATQLHELFPDLPLDELEILLTEVNGDLQLAAARIADGALQPWGEVSRKKDKKPPITYNSESPVPSRSESRGARGGRGGRGGAGGARGRGGHPKANTTQATSVLVTTSSRGHELEGGANGIAPQAALPVVTRQPSKTPSKLSWAQIARSQDRSTIAVPSTTPPVQPVVLESELDVEREDVGLEEPTTVEEPTWDDSKQLSVDPWPPTDATPEVANTETPLVVTLESRAEVAPKVVEVVEDAQQSAYISAPVAIPTSSPSNQPQVIATPSPKLTSRPAVSSHRSSARYKVTDQPVTLPLSFGVGIEKVGMQFGSLSVGDASVPETTQFETETPVVEPTPAATPPLKVEVTVPHPPPATAPVTSTSLTSMFQQQHSSVPQSQQGHSLPIAQSSISHHSLPTSISQPIASSQTNIHTVTPSSLHQFPQQQTSTQQQQPAQSHITQHQAPHLQPQSQHLPQQLQQNQPVPSLNQHGLIHLDQTQQTQAQPTAHSTYFRGSEASATTPYFHAPTPPVAQTQDSSYGSFGQVASQASHQQPSHSNTFGNNDYTYNDRFYESYTAQQQGFTSRNPLGHDDIKVISGQTAASTLPPSAAQGPQPHSSQASNQQPQPAGGQGPQQTYPPPVPYYFPHTYPQNQYYGSPYSSGYVPQPFVKYPAIFQPGPPGPGSAGNPAAKQPGNVGVQPQTPYNGSLYQQAGYDDYQTHQHSQHQHQHSHSLGLNQGMSDYGKQLYGGGQASMQGFMGLGGQSSSGGTGPASNGGPRGSPEASYKPYVKDVNVTRSVQGQQGQGQGPPQSQVQGPNGQGGTGQSFYGGNRFGGVGASSSSVSSGAQQGGPQAHLGYPQGVNEPNFYGYQRQQQGYWQ